jgi:hypothetical protein
VEKKLRTENWQLTTGFPCPVLHYACTDFTASGEDLRLSQWLIEQAIELRKLMHEA